MDTKYIIDKCLYILHKAQSEQAHENYFQTEQQLSKLWGFLTDELAGSAPEKCESAESSET